jgi:hypothetical protein
LKRHTTWGPPGVTTERHCLRRFTRETSVKDTQAL